VITAQH